MSMPEINPCEKRRHAWGDFHARSRFARSTIPEEKWGTTRSLDRGGLLEQIPSPPSPPPPPAPLTKKLNNFNTAQAMTTKLSNFF